MAERRIILLLSGHIATGKTTLVDHLKDRFGFKVFRTREALAELGQKKLNGKSPSRGFLQKYGQELDIEGDGKWVLENFQTQFDVLKNDTTLFIIDSVRILRQIFHFRKAYSYAVYHVHLTASEECRRQRFFKRAEMKSLSSEEAQGSWESAMSDETEKQVGTLAEDADLNIDAEYCSEEDVTIRVASYLKLLPPTKNNLVDVLVGGQFGSEGKGQIAAHIAPVYDCLVRVGGPNAGHTVYEEPEKHVFHLLPSGCYRNQHAKIVLGPGTVINIETIWKEIKKYGIADETNPGRLIIDENAVVIRQEDIEMEQEIKKNISSTGQGVGIATANNLIARLLADDKHKAKHCKELKPFIGSSFDIFESMYRNNKRILLEGTQGTWLSLYHGIYPYVTSRDTTIAGCLAEAGISPKRVNRIVMVTRTYPIRVGGSSGPFVSKEIDFDIIAARSGKNAEDLKTKEITTTTKIDRRVGEFSWTLFRKACELNSPTDIALTFADYLSIKNEKARRYDQLTPGTQQFIEEIERCSGVKVSLISTCFDYRAIIDRRNWK